MAGSYFVVIVLDPIKETILLPGWFTNKAGRDIGSPVRFLRTRESDEWYVQLDSLPNGEMWLADGWKEFAATSAIESGYVLLFHYCGHSTFNITMYLNCGVEKPHANFPPGGLPIDFFKRIDNDDCLFQLDLPPQLTPQIVDHLPNHLIIEHQDGTEWKVRWKIVDGGICLYRGWNKAAVHLSINEDDFIFFTYRGGDYFAVTVCKSSESQITTSLPRMIEGEVDMDQVTLLIVKMSEYMLVKNKPLYIPAWVVKKYFADKPEKIDVRLPSGQLRKWSFIWSSRDKTEGYLGDGWYSFVVLYDLKVKQRVRFYKEWNEEIINVEVLPPI